MCKNYVARSKVKVTVHTYSLCLGLSFSPIISSGMVGLKNYFRTNDHQDKTMCPVKEPWCYVKGPVYSSHLQLMHRLK